MAWADQRFKLRRGEPIGWAQGFGILFDDVVAALCTLLVIAAVAVRLSAADAIAALVARLAAALRARGATHGDGRVVHRRPDRRRLHRRAPARAPGSSAASSPTRTPPRARCSASPAALIAAHGAVSAEVARAMAEGALARSPATFAVAVTGIAGPDGGDAGQAGRHGLDRHRGARRDAADATLLQASGDRAAVRARRRWSRALELLLARLEARRLTPRQAVERASARASACAPTRAVCSTSISTSRFSACHGSSGQSGCFSPLTRPSQTCAASSRWASADSLDQRHGALEDALLRAPDARLAQRQRQRLAGAERVLDALQAADVLGQRPVHEHRRLALGLRRPSSMRSARAAWPASTASPRLEDVVARDVEDRAPRSARSRARRRIEQRELLDLLVRGEQVALDAVGEEGERALALGAGGDVLALRRQALGDPARQRLSARPDRRAS